jgi:hypothetical protein
MTILNSLKTQLIYSKHRLRQSLPGYVYLGSKRRAKLEQIHQSYFTKLKTDGFVVIPNYLNLAQCSQAIDDLKSSFNSFPTFVHASQDYRIYGFEHLSPVARQLAQEHDYLELAELVNREYSYCAFTLAGWLQSGQKGSSGDGWHRDSYIAQYKAMVYLNNVSLDNGPFEILPGSHLLKSVLTAMNRANLGFLQDRFTDYEVSRIEDALGTGRKSLIGQAGTLILFDSSTVHRGKPIINGERFSLTNYYYPISRDIDSVLKHFAPIITCRDLQ